MSSTEDSLKAGLQTKKRTFLGIGLSDGVKPSNLATHYYASLFGLSLMTFFGFILANVLTGILNTPLSELGRVSGNLGFYKELVFLALVPLFGVLSDKIGRKLIFAFGFAVVGIACYFFPNAKTLDELTVYQLLFSVGASAITGMFSTVIADYLTDRDRGKGTGLMGVFNGLGAMLSAIGLLSLPAFFGRRGYEFNQSLQMTFYVVGGIAFVSTIILLIGLKGGKATTKEESKGFLTLAKEGILAAKHPAILLAYLAAFVSRGDLALVGQTLTNWLTKYSLENGLSQSDAQRQAQLGIVVVQSVALFAAPIIGIMADRINRLTAVIIAVAISAIGYSSLFLIENPLGFNMKLALMLVGVGEVAGVIVSQVLIAQYAPKEIRGSIIGVFGFCGALGILTALKFGGYLFDVWTESAPFLLFGIFGAITVIYGLAIRNKVKVKLPMKTVVITGSTRGIGYGLANEFLKRGCKVVVSGRSQDACDKATAELSAKHNKENIYAVPCDVTNYEHMQNLWNKSAEKFGKIDAWINNAGISNAYIPFWEVSPETIKNVTDTNMLGAMNGSHVALKEMIKQGSGELYNMYGFGSDGRKANGLTLYGATKYGLKYLTEALTKEAKDTPIKIGSLSPGIVLTDLWDDLYEGMPERKEKSKKIVNILGDKVETVTPFLAEKVLENDKNGAKIAWLTGGKAFWRFATAAFNKRNLFD
ncbi:MAG TPA: SDR family NAD(P)-dependent oxidoreductase [Pyrinomonadaceae bacterium]|nr:SDR family NAD(P)-dependent oxidoreductase [Pyrinomonadaceae bacterium]